MSAIATPELIEALSAFPRNDFATSLVNQFTAKGRLSEKQIAAGQALVERAKARIVERANNTVEVDMSAIRALFETAKSNGLKRIGLYFGDVRVSLAPATGANAGALYVKRGDAYQGKIVDTAFLPVYGVDPSVGQTLLRIAQNPTEELRVIGKRTGICCCCGRELTNAKSISDGIGPICAEKWGL